MKRFQLTIRVYELDANVEFYSGLFGATPTIRSEHEARWVLDAPPMNFTVLVHGMTPGLEHLGFEVETAEELETVRLRFAKLDPCASEEAGPGPQVVRDRHWLIDPQGLLWEAIRTGAAQSSSALPPYEDVPS